MRAELAVGTVGRAEHVVAEADLAARVAFDVADEFPPVFATTRMIGLMEVAAGRAMKPVLLEGEMSVGYGVDVVHTAPTPPGARVEAEARYVGREGKLYVFEVVARDPAGEIGRGTHRRAVIETARLRAGAEKRRG